MQRRILHDGPNYRVVQHGAPDAPIVVVGFESWLPAPSRTRSGSTADFFAGHGHGFIAIQPEHNDWFQHDEILDAIAAIRAVTAGVQRVGYGASMGGFAAIAFAEDLALGSVVALAPQFSIQPARVPFEHRWRQFLPQIAFRHDKIDRIAPIRAGYVLFDPAHIDREHYRLIAAHHALAPVPVWFTGHEAVPFLHRLGLLGPLLLGLVEGKFDAATFRRQVRAGRFGSNQVWFGAAKALLRRGALHRAAAAMRRARAGALPNPLAADITEAEILRRLGRWHEADALLAPHRADPATAGIAQWFAEQADLRLLDSF